MEGALRCGVRRMCTRTLLPLSGVALCSRAVKAASSSGASNGSWPTIQRIKQGFRADQASQSATARGWVRSVRAQKTATFLEINDGSSLSGIQVVVDGGLEGVATGAAVSARGVLQPHPRDSSTPELHAESKDIDIVGPSDDTYPLQKKRHSLEFLREQLHFRARTNTISSILRVRHHLSRAVHDFFAERDFVHVHTPILTSSDCEGAGELFEVKASGLPEGEQFFGTNAYLTVSGQLHAESLCEALGRVYTFGPTFRADHSNTSRHAAEFYMVEPEIAFASMDDALDIARDLVAFCAASVLENPRLEEEITFFTKRHDAALRGRLESVASGDFARVSYDEAIDILTSESAGFQGQVQWGDDLSTVHERYLAESHFKRPVFVTDYPAAIKPFYMRQVAGGSPNGDVAQAFDLLVPTVGEIVGGSAREADAAALRSRMEASGLNIADYEWYLDLRRYGSVPHAGFGLGFDRLVQFLTATSNIRDVLPMPRAQRLCKL